MSMRPPVNPRKDILHSDPARNQLRKAPLDNGFAKKKNLKYQSPDYRSYTNTSGIAADRSRAVSQYNYGPAYSNTGSRRDLNNSEYGDSKMTGTSSAIPKKPRSNTGG